MAQLSLNDLEEIGTLFGQKERVANGVHHPVAAIDSRKISGGEIFFALKGEHTDGHAFVQTAFENGAALAVVSTEWFENTRQAQPNAHFFTENLFLSVQDPLVALQKLANRYRKKFPIPIVTIAGSNGKTTTKEMTAAVLGTTFRVVATEGNFNNHIGVPLTLFRLRDDTEIAVVEMGINHHGEMNELCQIAEPTHGLITNIGHEHCEFLGTPEEIAMAEGELYRYLSRTGGSGFVNADDGLASQTAGELNLQTLYGIEQPNLGLNIWAKEVQLNQQGCASFKICTPKQALTLNLQISGRHNVYNALAAAAIGLNFGAKLESVKLALEHFVPKSGSKRMERICAAGLTILNDSYNANPESMRSALGTLASLICDGKKIVLLGDMLELGSVSETEHRKLGEFIEAAGIDLFFGFGNAMKWTCQEAPNKCKGHFNTKSEMVQALKEVAAPGDALLFKGSRGMKMEEVLEALLASIQ
ncbi:UDP-N-acetylmuramoylalanyl-D-glutamyl-2,6-diaminopimelate/D-alanyl-D-alanyl ligase [Chloroherpeton thalassium ATCC 35110]|uniref:UDP-N-acetylmuramoyl-tripeptide--D-alanyl-D-alanine ligase n=1 Tax=Chloroherpeton thalassium (strain ATCC 35110 / GB-78) TaxID=517418 RepID=B3QWT3_CHLT3|nr:UDP-N-acetylmuramoyl-tripeptide--D-alanyl-D-alanine ligase [Chloroherpeton thalassium]ACF13297.1 UDP-N-acetylmuramoylalanyl-D-glutamyl-2,6-diaminopimelate/D-alanyl-D-alanyl ligase [Chloroherpeton thalassium ATCC 35110]